MITPCWHRCSCAECENPCGFLITARGYPTQICPILRRNFRLVQVCPTLAGPTHVFLIISPAMNQSARQGNHKICPHSRDITRKFWDIPEIDYGQSGDICYQQHMVLGCVWTWTIAAHTDFHGNRDKQFNIIWVEYRNSPTCNVQTLHPGDVVLTYRDRMMYIPGLPMTNIAIEHSHLQWIVL